MSCTSFTTGFNDKDVALQGPTGMILLSCHDATRNIAVNVTIGTPTVGDYVPKHSSEGGRIAVTGADGEFVTTSDAANTGKISVSAWDSIAHHITGSFSLTWPRDASGQGGNAQGQFDIPNLPTPR